MSEDGLQQGIAYFERAIARDPRFALPYTALADCYAVLAVFGVVAPRAAYPQARDAVTKALAIEPDSARAHTSLGHIMVQYEHDWAEGEREYRRAIELDPNYAMTYHYLALLLGFQGRMDEAIVEMRRAQMIEPLARLFSANVGVLLYHARRFDAAVHQLERTLEIDSGFDHARSVLGRTYLALGDTTRAIEEFSHVRGVGPGSRSELAGAYATAGRPEQARTELARLLLESRRRYVSAYDISTVYAALDDKSRALRWLGRAVDERSQLVNHVWTDPALDPIREDPRFARIAQRVGRASPEEPQPL
jgi:tetratricopeptide (TPR) repeat protein